MGFSLNETKTKVFRNYHKQIITGVVVNEKMNILKEKRKQIRQEMYYINKYGISGHNEFTKENVTLASMMGKVNYGLFLNSSNKEFKSYQKKLQSML